MHLKKKIFKIQFLKFTIIFKKNHFKKKSFSNVNISSRCRGRWEGRILFMLIVKEVAPPFLLWILFRSRTFWFVGLCVIYGQPSLRSRRPWFCVLWVGGDKELESPWPWRRTMKRKTTLAVKAREREREFVWFEQEKVWMGRQRSGNEGCFCWSPQKREIPGTKFTMTRLEREGQQRNPLVDSRQVFL